MIDHEEEEAVRGVPAESVEGLMMMWQGERTNSASLHPRELPAN